jgi:hypothetical protein
MLTALLCAPVLAQSEDFQRERTAQRTALVERLLKLATWCQDQQLFAERDKTWRQVIEIDASNMEARKGLRYARNQDGTWKDPPTRSVQNMNKKALEELPAKRADVVRPYRDALLEQLSKETDVDVVARIVYADVLAVDPDDARIHELQGDVKDGDRWVLTETVRGKQRRAEIKSIVKTAIDSPVALEPTSPSSAEAGWADQWTCSTRVGALRVLGCGGASDCEALARTLAACRVALAGILDVELQQPETFNFYLVAGNAARTAFLERCALGEDARNFLSKAPGGGLPGGNDTVLFESDVKRRNDCAVRNALSHLLWKNYGLRDRNGWAWEGLGIYLTRELVGTRFTWYSLAGPNANALKTSLLAPESNWMNEGLKLLGGGAADLGVVLAKPVSEFGLEDMLVSYVFSAYLIEGRPDKAADFLQRTGKDAKPEESSRAVFGWSMATLQDHLVRWLQERR